MKKRWKAGLAVCLTLLLGVFVAAEPGGTRTRRAVAAAADTPTGRLEDGRVCLPILMYHEVKPSHTGKDCITPGELESDLSYLKKNGYTAITMTELIDYTDGKSELPPHPIILSFDDGYLSSYVYAFPLIQKYDMQMVLSLIGKSTDDFTETPSDDINCSHATWDQIREMLASGHVEIQNHTYNMHHIIRRRFGCQKRKGESGAEYERELTADLDQLQQEIYVMTGTRPNTFTYPYGQVSPESVPVLKKLGFRASLTCDYGLNLVSRDPQTLFGLRRICRSHGSSAHKLLAGAQKTLRFRR